MRLSLLQRTGQPSTPVKNMRGVSRAKVKRPCSLLPLVLLIQACRRFMTPSTFHLPARTREPLVLSLQTPLELPESWLTSTPLLPLASGSFLPLDPVSTFSSNVWGHLGCQALLGAGAAAVGEGEKGTSPVLVEFNTPSTPSVHVIGKKNAVFEKK